MPDYWGKYSSPLASSGINRKSFQSKEECHKTSLNFLSVKGNGMHLLSQAQT